MACGEKFGAICTVDLGRHGGDLVAQAHFIRIQHLEVAFLFGCLSNSVGEFGCPGAAFGEVHGHRSAGVELLGNFLDGVDVAIMVPGEHVDGHNRSAAVDLHVLELLAEVVAALVDLVRVLFEERFRERLAGDDLVLAGVGLEAPYRCDQHGSIGSESRG